jgi:putative ABC transport system substrate-binding protein
LIIASPAISLAADAEELVNLRPDVIFALNGAAALAVQQRTSIIPIVFAGSGDPTSNGLVRNIARPEGNITGFANIFGSLGGRWLELFKEAVPRLTRVADMFFVNELSVREPRDGLRATIAAAAVQLGVTIIKMPVRNAVEIEPAISAFAAEPDGGLLVTGVPVANPLAMFEAIGRRALYYHLPWMFGGAAGRETRARSAAYQLEGWLLGHGSDILDLARRASSYVDRILRGAKPGELPVQYPTKFELVVNLKTAKAIGVTIPEAILAQADLVIE